MKEEMEVSKKVEMQQTDTDKSRLLELAINKNLDTDKLNALMNMQERLEKRNAEKEFNFNFAKMQREYIPAIKTKAVASHSGKKIYSYCPLPEILSIYAPILSEFNFSYYWTEEDVTDLEKRITCFLSGYGHTRSANIVLPFMDVTGMTNKIQARGATSEYGRRYTFMNVTGCIVLDNTDTDGQLKNQGNTEEIKNSINESLPSVPIKFRQNYIIQMGNAQNSEELNNIAKNVNTMRSRCQRVVKLAEEKGHKTEVVDGLNNSSSENELVVWESYVKKI